MKNKLLERDLARLRLASVISQVGSAVTWTGLPTYVATLAREPKLSGALFISSTVAGIVSTLLASRLMDKGLSRSIAISSNFLCAGIMLALAFVVGCGHVGGYFLLALSLSIVSSLGDFSVNYQYQGLAKQANIEKSLARQGAFLSVAKIVGMGLGPVAFSWLQNKALILDAASFLIAGCMIASIKGVFLSRAITTAKAILPDINFSSRLMAMLAASALAGLLGFPLVAASLQLLHGQSAATTTHSSAFWLVGSCSMTLSHLFSMRLKDAHVNAFKANLCVAPIAACGTWLLASNFSLVSSLFGLALVTGSLPAAGNLVRAEFLRMVEPGQLGRILGVEQILRDSIALAALIILSASYVSPSIILVVFALAVIPLRTVILSVALSPQTKLVEQI
jgi:hypothetical protein